MRLLLRSGVHRPVDGGVEVASSPDTPRREAWLWQVRVLDFPSAPADEDSGVTRVALGLPREGGPATVEISCDRPSVETKAEALIAGDPVTLERGRDELTVLIVGQGSARLEGRHLLHGMDAMVLEGDDPLALTLERVGSEPTSVAVVRLWSTGERPISWVP